jgi:hypothetical protein
VKDRKCAVCGLPTSYPYQIHKRGPVERGEMFDVQGRGGVRAHKAECGHKVARDGCWGCIASQWGMRGSEAT